MSFQEASQAKQSPVVTGGWLLLLLMTIIYFLGNLQKVIVPGATFNQLQQAFQADATWITRLGSAFILVYACGQLLVGLLADRYGGVRVVTIGGALFCLGALLSGMKVNLYVLMAARTMTGLGASSFYLSAVKEISKRPVNQMPLLLSMLLLIGYSGSIVGTAPFIAGVEKLGYRPMLLLAGAVSLVAYALFLCISHKSRDAVNQDVKFRLSTFKVALQKENVYIIISQGFCFGLYFVMQAVIGKKFLEDYSGMNAINAGYVLTTMMTIAAVDSLVVANVFKLIGHRFMPIVRFGGYGTLVAVLMLFLAILGNVRSPWLSIAAMLLLSITGNVGSIYSVLLRLINEAKCFGTVVSVANFFAYIVPAILGASIGCLMDIFAPQSVGDKVIYGRPSYLLVFSVMLFLTLVGAVFTTLLKEPPRDKDI